MNEPRDDDHVQRERDDWRTIRRDDLERSTPRDGFRYEEDEDAPYRGADPRKKVRAPGAAMALVGCIWLGLALAMIVFVPLANALEGARPGKPDYTDLIIFSAIFGGVIFLANAVVILGGLRMRNCQSRGLALTAAVLLGFFGIVSLAFGIWALAVLMDPDVIREFERVARSGQGADEGE